LGDLSQSVKVSEIKPPSVLALIMTLRFGHLVGKAIPSQFLMSKGLKRYVYFDLRFFDFLYSSNYITKNQIVILTGHVLGILICGCT